MKILYLNHVCWEWIFQRPQILALELEKDFECEVVNKKFIFGKKTTANNQLPTKQKVIWQLPRSNNIPLFSIINNFVYRRSLMKTVKSYDAIWVCHPSLSSAIPSSYQGRVIYDCMDNHEAITDYNNKEHIRKLEQQLIQRADLIIVSSDNLKRAVPGLDNAHVVRNGYLSSIKPLPVKPALRKKIYQAGYFGTVSSWFDYKLLADSIKAIDNIEYHIIGPVSAEVDNAIRNLHCKNIIIEGTVEHNQLKMKVEKYDILIMPFVINDIILSVDPVKLYEYINYGKCIISVWYPEIDRFSPFVYFYKNQEEYDKLIYELEEKGFPPKFSEEERRVFLSSNTWDMRYLQIKELLKSLM